MKNADILKVIDEWAPFETAEEYDNVGLLVGGTDDEVSGILIALDVTEAVIDEAKAMGANLIVTHHPVIFYPMTCITDGTSQGKYCLKLIKYGISVISAHTNLDMAEGGVSCALAEKIGLKNIKTSEVSPFFRIGELEREMSAREFASHVKHALGSNAVLSAGDKPEKIKTVCVASGAGGGDTWDAKLIEADVYLTGEAKQNNAIEALSGGVYMMCAGHYETEVTVLCKIRDCLQKYADDVQSLCTINITKNGINPFDIMD